MSFTVTRQIQWPTGEHIVEVSQGGIDFTNPDALVKKYDGEFETFSDPREAVETAIAICRAWNKDGSKPRARVGIGATGGYTMPFDASTFKDVRREAKKIYSKLPKCPTCKAIMDENPVEAWEAGEFYKDGSFLSFQDGELYCSEICSERASLYECEKCGEFFPLNEIHYHTDKCEERAEV
jgi:hypothetical protein